MSAPVSTSISATPALPGPAGAAPPSQGRRRERLVARMERLVQGLEVVATRISSGRVTRTQRSMLVARYNDLQRKVNELDGIVTSEGRETRGQARVGQAVVAKQKRPVVASRRTRAPARRVVVERADKAAPAPKPATRRAEKPVHESSRPAASKPVQDKPATGRARPARPEAGRPAEKGAVDLLA